MNLYDKMCISARTEAGKEMVSAYSDTAKPNHCTKNLLNRKYVDMHYGYKKRITILTHTTTRERHSLGFAHIAKAFFFISI